MEQNTPNTGNTEIDRNVQLLEEKMRRKGLSRIEANCKQMVDVDWGDLEHFIDNARRKKDAKSFDTAIEILKTIKEQVLGAK